MIQFKLGNNADNNDAEKNTQAASNTAEPKIENNNSNQDQKGEEKPAVGFNLANDNTKTDTKPETGGGFKLGGNVETKEESPAPAPQAQKLAPATATAASVSEASFNMPDNTESVSIHIGKEEESRQEEEDEQKKKKSFADIYEDLNKKLMQMTPIKMKEITTFFRLMATMQNAGITLLKALKIMVRQTQNKRFQVILSGFVDKVEEGSTFSDCLRDYPSIFPESTVGMISSGEASGRLSHVLIDIANMMEKSQKLKSKIKGAMIYPITVIIVLFLVGIVVMVMIVPKFVELFDQLEGELPMSTKVLIGTSNFLQEYWWVVLLSPVALFFAIHQFKKTDYGRLRWDWLMLRIPIFGSLNRKVALSRFTSNLASMGEAGISIVKALQINADSIGNRVYKNRILDIRDDVEQGIPIAENIKNDTFLFPDLVVSMIDVGEQTATITEVSRKVAEFYDQEVDATVKNLTTAMEPIIIVVLASAVGGLVAAIMQPIFMMSDLAQNA